jgi:terminase, large subunit
MPATELLAPTLPDEVLDNIRAIQRREASRIFVPREQLSLLEYAEKYRRWADGTSYRVADTPYLTELLEAYSDPGVEEIVCMKPSQSGFTEGLLLNALAFHMDLDPVGILVVIPSVDEAEKWSKKKLQPMVDAMPRLHGKLEDGSRKSSNTMLEKAFPGGSLGIVGSNSGRGFRMVTVGRVFSDDVEGWDDTAGSGDKNEGDQVTLIRRRTDRIADRTLVWGSTPKFVGGRIHRLFLGAERRGRFHVQCPQCGEAQVLRWGGKDTAYGMKWETEQVSEDYVERPGEVLRGTTVHRPRTAYYACEANGCVIEEDSKADMVAAGEFLTEDGEPVRAPGFRRLGFWFNGLVVTLPGSEWPRMVEEFLNVCDDPDALRAWYNLVLAEPWEDRGETVDPTSLESRKAVYGSECPEGVGILTGFVDVQVNRLEFQVTGWGVREEAWVLGHWRIYGDPEQDAVWERLEGLRKRAWAHASGQKLRVEVIGVDTGYLPSEVYRYVKGKEGEGVYAFDGQGGKRSYVVQPTKRPNRSGVRPWKIAVDGLKDVLFRRLRIQQPGPGYLHYVSRPPETDPPEGQVVVDLGMDREYFAQAEGEVIKWERTGGQLRRKYVQRGANEFIDLHVGCMGALLTLPNVRERLPELVKRAALPPSPSADADTGKQARGNAARRGGGGRRGGWVRGY